MSIYLTGGGQGSSSQPADPAIAKVPECGPGRDVEEKDVEKVSNKEKRVGLEKSLTNEAKLKNLRSFSFS